MSHVVFPSLLLCLTVIAGGLSAWMVARTSGVARLPGCGPGSGCAAVAASRWARWAVFPVAALGAGTYLLLGTALLLMILRPAAAWSGLLRESVAALSMVTAGAAIWFVFLQVAVVRR